ncbi:SatD family protein [Propionibacteriaceae bacterium Y1923]|uniref:SatD family protein n=1 Tax=Aestuariimicrobium sp. Y1814 TaxID=3418742 RepID=UPI003C1A1724
MKPESFTCGDEGWWAVVNIDQRRSRHSPDLVPSLLESLADLAVALPAERTVGDEVQVLTRTSATLTDILEVTARSDDWRVGIGFGPVETPLPPSVRQARGPAFVAAREAVEAAHSSPSNLAMRAPDDVGAADYAGNRVASAGTIAGLLHHVWSRRTREGWDVVDQLREHGTGRAAAEAMGISPSAVSQRLRTAGWQPAEQGRELLRQVFDDILQAP